VISAGLGQFPFT